MSHSLPPMAEDEKVLIGDCIQNDDDTCGVYFIFTTTLGNIYLFNIDRSREDLGEKEAIPLTEKGVNNASAIIPHKLY